MGSKQPTIRLRPCSCCGIVHVYDAAMARHLVNQFGASQIMLGTGYAFAFRDHAPVAHVVPVQ